MIHLVTKAENTIVTCVQNMAKIKIGILCQLRLRGRYMLRVMKIETGNNYFLRRAIPIRPISPEPNNQTAAGTGTTAGE